MVSAAQRTLMRKQNPLFKQAKWALVGMEEAQKVYERQLARLVDWSDKDDVNAWRKEYRARLRARKIPKDRVCPQCKEFKPESPQWVAKTRDTAMCLICWRRQKRGAEPLVEPVTVPPLLAPARWSVDVKAIIKIRQMLGLTRAELAKEMGWSYSYQAKLEHGYVRDVDQATGQRILEVLAEWGVCTQDITG